mgnify:CR=1 FL=1
MASHEVATVPEMGWAGKTNGELLSLARGQFDVFVTADQGLEYQQTLTNRDVAVVVLAGRTNRYKDLLALIPAALDAIQSVRPGSLVRIAD